MSDRWRLLLSFAALYVIWGSTYLAIAFAIETIPPFLMAGFRFVSAGLVMYLVMRMKGAPRPTRAQWIGATIVGALLLTGGNGGVTWAEQRVPSSLAALIIALMPLWMVVLAWAMEGTRPTPRTGLGLLLGLAGVALLIALLAGTRPHLLGGVVRRGAGFVWALGSLYARRVSLPKMLLMAVAMENLAGGVLLLAVGTVSGEWARLDLGALSLTSVGALIYLIVFGSIIAFSAYAWVLQNTDPAKASTYAYVNPAVALLLGWLLGNEPMTARILVAATIIIGAVVLITTRSPARPPVRARRRLKAT